jgi:hypothetical protein
MQQVATLSEIVWLPFPKIGAITSLTSPFNQNIH